MNINPIQKADEILIFDERTIEERDYWLQKLSGEILPANIRLDYPRPARYTGREGSCPLYLSGETHRKLSKLTGDDPFLLYAVLAAGLNICLFKYTGTASVVIGSPALKTGEGEAQPGQPGNMLAIVTEVDETLSFRQFLVNVRKTLLEDYERHGYPFLRLLKDLGIEDMGNKCPLFDVALVLEDIHTGSPGIMNDITVTFAKGQGQLSGRVDFNTDLYMTETIERFAGHYSYILETALENTDTPVSGLQVLTPAERHRLLVEWNDSAARYPRDKCNHQLFEECVERAPGSTALVYGDRRLTYRELDERANQVAHYLEKLGVGPDVLVGIFMERSPELVISLLAVLKAGGAYVPLDPSYPKERLAAMLEDAEMLHVLLTKEPLLKRLPVTDVKVVCMDKDWDVFTREPVERPVFRATVDSLVYVIFTSGSTGRPKGAAVYHRGWTNLMHWFSTEFKIDSNDKVLVVSSFSFDITQRSLSMPLINGAQLHLLTSEYYDPGLILQSVDEGKITLLNCSPSTFYPLLENTGKDAFEKLRSLRVLFLGGEAISASRLRHWAESDDCKAVVANVYGAAECTDVSSFYCLTDYDRYIKTSVPAGKPIFNSQVYILDKNLNPVPMGTAGEICLAGDGVGKGYINDDALTAEKYVSNPFSKDPGARLYRTGDLGRFLPDLNIEFIGRVDHQVKVRGFRVDLGDIETTLRLHDSVREAVVVDREYTSGDRRLVAYLVLNHDRQGGGNREKLIDELKLFLKRKLPEYMFPGAFLVLDQLPLNPNGKVDRGALPDPETAAAAGMKAEKDGPRTPLEETLVGIFSEFLKIEQIGIRDNFFDLGGHSLLATQVISRVNEIYGLKLNQVDFLVDPTITGLASRIESVRPVDDHPRLQENNRDTHGVG